LISFTKLSRFYIESPAYLGLLSIFAISPLSFVTFYGIPIYVLLLFAGLPCVKYKKFSGIDLFLVGPLIVYLLYSFFNDYFYLRFSQYTTTLLVYYIFISRVDSLANLFVFLKILVVFLLIGSFLSFYFFLVDGIIPWNFIAEEIDEENLFIRFPSGWASGAVELGYTYAPIIPLLIFGIRNEKINLWRIMYLILLLVIIFLLLLNASRSSLVGFIFFSFIFFIKYRLKRLLFVILVTTGLAVFLLQDSVFLFLFSKSTEISSDSRLSFSNMFYLFESFFLAPFGIHFDSNVFQSFLSENNDLAPHNIFLTSYFEGGLPILFFTVIIVGYFLIRSYRLTDYYRIKIFFIGPFLIVLIHSMFHNNSFILSSFVWGIYFGLIKNVKRYENRFIIACGKSNI